MIIPVENGYLELFRRYPGSRLWSGPATQRFLRSFSHSDVAILAMRRQLMTGGRPYDVSRMSAEHVLERLASVVSSGDILLLEDPGAGRLPGTGSLLRSPAASVMLLSIRSFHPATDFYAALDWLQNLNSNAEELNNLGQLTWTQRGGKSSDSAEGPQMKQELDRLLRSGELVAVWHEVVECASGSITGSPAPTPIRVQAVSNRPEPRVFEETPTFPANIDAAAIAASKREAARLGIPFCEECLKAARGRK